MFFEKRSHQTGGSFYWVHGGGFMSADVTHKKVDRLSDLMTELEGL